MAPQQPDHQAQQDALLTALAGPLLRAFDLLDLSNLAASFPRFAAAVAALVQAYGQSSAVLASRDYAAQRVGAGVPGRFTHPTVSPAGVEQVTKELQWATQALWSADVKAGDPVAVQKATDTALTQVTGVAEKLVLDASRGTTLSAVAADRQARGWARVPEAGACSFCLLLATRGAVYKTKTSAGTNTRSPRNKNSSAAFVGGGEFKVHDHCRCTVEPLFGAAYEPTAQVRAAEQLYRDSTKGLRGKDALNAFRKAVDAQRAAGTSLA